MKAKTLPGFEERNEDFGLTAPDGKHYWITPPDLMAELDAEFHFDFDPCPHPRPEGFDGLEAEWGESSYVNPPFKGPTAWVRKAIAENAKGKRVVFVFPIDKWVLMLLQAGAKVRNLRDVKWCAIEDGSQGKGTGRHIAAFILDADSRKALKTTRDANEQSGAQNDARDAARYRYLRNNWWFDHPVNAKRYVSLARAGDVESVDAAIDQALGGKE